MIRGPGARGRGSGAPNVFSQDERGLAPSSRSLKGSDAVANDNFGSAVAIAGPAIAIGAPNHASQAGRIYVFGKTGTSWRQTVRTRKVPIRLPAIASAQPWVSRVQPSWLGRQAIL